MERSQLSYSDLIRNARESRHLGSVDLSVRIRRNPGYISRIETGVAKDVPPPDVMVALAHELGISVVDQLAELGYPVREGMDAELPEPIQRLLPSLRAIQWNSDRLKLITDILRSMQQIDQAATTDPLPVALNSR